MYYYVYILYSVKFHHLYIGFTHDLFTRFNAHNSGQSKATKPYIPYRLIFYEAFLDKRDALHRFKKYHLGGDHLRGVE